MKILLKKVLIANSASVFNNTIKDILIVNGIIQSIQDNIIAEADTVIEEKDIIVSSGWVDCFAHFCDPGFEYRETVESGSKAAMAGGFTQVFVLPNTLPIIQNKSQVEYIVQKSKQLPITIFPLGALTKNAEGKELAEMYDMYQSRAIAFSDGLNPVQTPGLFLKALQYTKAFNGTIIQMPIDKSISANGLINEGIISTQLGLPGLPTIAEEIMIKRDIDLLRYTESKLHITGISTAKSIALIKAAKAEGLQISCSVTPYHLFFNDEDVQQYDTNLKLNPPLRTKADMLSLQQAVINGDIDCIATHHLPQNNDEKICEFEYAANGMIGLQTAFAAINHAIPQLSNDAIAALFSHNATTIFGLEKNNIEEGTKANLTLFSRTEKTILNKENNKSKSYNTPFADKELNGKVIGVITKNNLYIN
ncbi:MAG: dihydroorotase [Chitinophagaceae bacterium]|nr:dihydroorotase [Chitinophagaceae bacterium]MCW5905241.1 dihydroorotase [Chitinophagaceae bacterium]